MEIIIEVIAAMGMIVAISFISLAKKYRGGDDKNKQIAKIEAKAITGIYIAFVLILLLLFAITTEKIPAKYLPIITVILLLMNIVLIAILLNHYKKKSKKN